MNTFFHFLVYKSLINNLWAAKVRSFRRLAKFFQLFCRNFFTFFFPDTITPSPQRPFSYPSPVSYVQRKSGPVHVLNASARWVDFCENDIPHYVSSSLHLFIFI